MNKFKRVSALVIASLTLIWASDPSHALGFGRPFSRAILGETLSVTVPIRLEPGEELTDECIVADVYFGDEKVLPSAIQAMVLSGEGSDRVLKVSTTTALVNEPIVTVYLAAGCKAKMTRKFVAFADPPGMVMPSMGEPLPATVAAVDEQPSGVVGASVPKRSNNRKASSGAASRSARAVARASGASADANADTYASNEPLMSARAARTAPEPEGDVRPSQRAQLKSEQSLGAADRMAAGSEGGRLVLDSADVAPMDLPDLRMTSSLGVMLQADDQSPEVMARRRTAAALWLALNATPEAMARDRQRVTELEQRLALLTTENQRAKQALADAQGLGGSGKWLALLALLAVAAAGVAGYFAWRLKSGSKGKDAWWQSQSDARQREEGKEPTSSDMERTSAFVRTTAPEKPNVAAAVAQPPAVFTPPPAKQNLHEIVPDTPRPPIVVTSAPAALASRSAEPLREVSVEELIDLEQQAEFFVVLGQDEAAMSLLEGHVMNTTGASPLPFLKLMELYRRADRRNDYDRVQSQFNLRFNAHAPAWDADLQEGHTLEDYPDVVARLQALWAEPTQAMEVLEKSLTRPEAGADTFDLPAYRELLFLYAVARDLSEREVHDRPGVDLLLPAIDNGDTAGRVEEDKSEDFKDSGEPLMATRPNKAQPEALPSLNLDFHLDEMTEPGEVAKH